MSGAADPRIELVARLTAAFGEEIGRRDPRADIPWPTFPTVQSMVGHLGGVHRWVTDILLTQDEPVGDETLFIAAAPTRAWFEEGRTALLEALRTVPPDSPCWIIGDRRGTAAFWRRRMVFENVKHLMDVRASGGGTWEAAAELTPTDYADGIDELFTEFLPRSRLTLYPLPGAVVLQATDSDRSWRVDADWTIDADTRPTEDAAEVFARTADLALTLWERADPFEPGARFRITVDRAPVAGLRDAPLHPW